MNRGVKFLVISLAFVFLVAFVFLASSFVTITQENNLVSITNGFDNRLLTGQQIGVPNLNTKIDISIALKINNEQQLDTFLSQ
ncbi:MAG: hypothetical protein QXT71_00520, partial [Thermoplasmata archaeon]